MEQFDAYADQVCSKIRWKKVHPLVREELLEHLMESSEERESEGLGAEESAEAAVSAMGDAALSGAKLNALYKPRVDILMIVALALLLLAVFFMMPLNWWACVALVALCAVFAAFNVRKLLGKFGSHLFLVGVAALVAVLLFAPTINGRKMMPSLEFAGIFLLVSGVGAFVGTRNVKNAQTIAAATALAFLSGFLVYMLPHFTMFMIMGITFWAMFLKSDMPRTYVWVLLGIAMLLGFFIVVSSEYRATRLAAQFAVNPNPPWQYEYGAGYLPSIIREAWRNAQWFGPTSMSNEYLLNPLTKIASYFGRVPAYLIITANIVLCWRMLSLSSKLKDSLSSCVAFGLSMLVTIMTALGLLNGVGLLLADVQPLFLTQSGAYWLLQGLSVATVFALNYNRDYIRLEQGGKMKDTKKPSLRIRIQIERS